jgi:hypothetical protein
MVLVIRWRIAMIPISLAAGKFMMTRKPDLTAVFNCNMAGGK